jgi:hypothetical protein
VLGRHATPAPIFRSLQGHQGPWSMSQTRKRPQHHPPTSNWPSSSPTQTSPLQYNGHRAHTTTEIHIPPAASVGASVGKLLLWVGRVAVRLSDIPRARARPVRQGYWCRPGCIGSESLTFRARTVTHKMVDHPRSSTCWFLI